jgi:membrane associated rhomboid family serine protease
MDATTGEKASHYTSGILTGVVGASGAVYGLLAAYAYLFPNNKLVFIFIPYPIAAKYFVPAIIVLDLFFGFNPSIGTGIAHFAHVGGAVIGFLMVIFWNKYNKKDFY